VFGNDFPLGASEFLWGEHGLRYRASPEQMDRIRAEEYANVDVIAIVLVCEVSAAAQILPDCIAGTILSEVVQAQLAGRDCSCNGEPDRLGWQQPTIIGELHEGVLRIRMVPIAQIFSRFPRLVRDLSKTLKLQRHPEEAMPFGHHKR
jgi:chemotaxis protein histidine kinase CheA